MTDQPELLPCPFCGGQRARTVHIRDGRQAVCICGACGKPEFNGRLAMPSAEDRAIAAWNARTPDPRIERLEAINAELLEGIRIALGEIRRLSRATTEGEAGNGAS